MMILSSVRKSCFTLLELLVVLFIISFGVIITGVKVKELYQEQRFLSETQQVLSHLAMAQDLMLIMDTDVQVHFDLNQKEMWLEIEKPLNEPWARLVERKVPLSAIRSMEFKGHPVKELKLLFSLGQMDKGLLVLFDGEQNKMKGKQDPSKIELLGYPNSFSNKKIESNEREKPGRSERLYPAEVYEKLYQNADKKNPKP